ncbi:MAG: hypothetical protein WDM79_17475 [Terricaulis sp.]
MPSASTKGENTASTLPASVSTKETPSRNRSPGPSKRPISPISRATVRSSGGDTSTAAASGSGLGLGGASPRAME